MLLLQVMSHLGCSSLPVFLLCVLVSACLLYNEAACHMQARDSSGSSASGSPNAQHVAHPSYQGVSRRTDHGRSQRGRVHGGVPEGNAAGVKSARGSSRRGHVQARKVLEVVRGAPAEDARALHNPPNPPHNRYSNNVVANVAMITIDVTSKHVCQLTPGVCCSCCLCQLQCSVIGQHQYHNFNYHTHKTQHQCRHKYVCAIRHVCCAS